MALGGEPWLEAFEAGLIANEDDAYLKYTRELLEDKDISANAIAADPLLLLKIDLYDLNYQQLDVFLRVHVRLSCLCIHHKSVVS